MKDAGVATSPADDWNIEFVLEGGEYHHLSRDDLLGVLGSEWEKSFNFIGRDVDCVGRLGVFFRADAAYVCYEDFEAGRWLSSRGPAGPDEAGDELVRLTPDDVQEYSFARRSLIPKAAAWAIVWDYVTTLRTTALGE